MVIIIGIPLAGGLFIFHTNGFEVINSTFSDNTSPNGAGMFMTSPAKIVNSTTVNNIGTGVFMRQNNSLNTIIALNTGGDCELDQTEFDFELDEVIFRNGFEYPLG